MGALGQSGRKGITNAMKVYDSELSQNFNTSPLTISGLKGDTYDYEMVMVNKVASGNNTQMMLFFNSDLTANYRRYHMNSQGGSAVAGINDATASPFISQEALHISIVKLNITGSSGGERKISLQSGAGGSVNYRAEKNDLYWKNTADEITSLTLKNNTPETTTMRVILYATIKDSAQEGWELIDTLSWSSETAQKSFSSLSGDVDIYYKVIWSGDQELNIELNDDNGSNYTRQYLQNAGGAISASNASNTSIITDGINSEVFISAISGIKRICKSSASNTSSAQQSQRSVWWTNTADEITSIDCTPSASATGTAYLYRKIPFMDNPDTLPFELIREIDLSGDQSTGQLLSNLTGDSSTLYKLVIEGIGSASANDLRIRPNDDSGSNYNNQQLKGLVSTASGSATAPTYLQICENCEGANVFKTDVYFYPLSGEERPFLIMSGSDEDLVEFNTGWWTNTADEITSLRIFATSSNSLGATTAKLYRMI